MADQCENKWHLNIGLTEKKERNESLSLLKHMKFDEIRNHSQRSQIKPIKSLKFKSKGFPKKKKANENETRTQEWGMSKMGRKWDENGTLRTTKIKWMKKKNPPEGLSHPLYLKTTSSRQLRTLFFLCFFFCFHNQKTNGRQLRLRSFLIYLFIFWILFDFFFHCVSSFLLISTWRPGRHPATLRKENQ